MAGKHSYTKLTIFSTHKLIHRRFWRDTKPIVLKVSNELRKAQIPWPFTPPSDWILIFTAMARSRCEGSTPSLVLCIILIFFLSARLPSFHSSIRVMSNGFSCLLRNRCLCWRWDSLRFEGKSKCWKPIGKWSYISFALTKLFRLICSPHSGVKKLYGVLA